MKHYYTICDVNAYLHALCGSEMVPNSNNVTYDYLIDTTPCLTTRGWNNYVYATPLTNLMCWTFCIE